MSSPSPGFTPLSYETLASLSPKTRQAMTLDFVEAGAGDRVISILPLIPFVSKGSWSSVEFNRPLACAVSRVCPPKDFPAVIAALRESYEQMRQANASSQPAPPLDLGDVAVELMGALRQARLHERPAQAEELREKLRSLFDEPDLLLRGFLKISYAPSSAFSHLPRWLMNDNIIHPSIAAYADFDQEPWLWDAVWRRPEWREHLGQVIYHNPAAPYRDNHEVVLLNRPEAWGERFEAMNALLLTHLRETSPAAGEERPPVMAKLIAQSLFPASPQAPANAREGVWELFGERCYAMLLGRDGGHAQRQEWSASRLFNVFNTHQQKHPLPGEAGSLARALFHGGSIHHFDSGVFRDLLFSPDPERREAFLAHYAPAPDPRRPEAEACSPPDPYSDYLSLSNLGAAIYCASRSNHPGSLLRVLDAAGPRAVAEHPGPRKGLDYSALMCVAQHGSLDMFEAALDWAERHGALDECAEAKAWVMSEGSTRKKGDLLALCVALADLDKAAALLARRPDFKMTSARDTAKAMGDKLRNERAGRAVSAWESLLFNKTLALQSADPDPASASFDFEAPPPAAPRRARL